MPAFEKLFPELGFPIPSYPALFRQATSYTWPPRQRKIPLWWLEWARGDVLGACLGCAAPALAGPIRTGQARRGIQAGMKPAEAAKGSPKRPEGTKRRRARGATHTVVRRTGAQEMVENVTYFEHSQKERFLGPNQGAPNVTQSE